MAETRYYPSGVMSGRPFAYPDQAVDFFAQAYAGDLGFPEQSFDPARPGVSLTGPLPEGWLLRPRLTDDWPTEVVELPAAGPDPYDIDESAWTESAWYLEQGRDGLNGPNVAPGWMLEFPDLPGRRIGFVPDATVNTFGIGLSNPIAMRLATVNTISGWEAACRRTFDQAERKSRPVLAKSLGSLETALDNARGYFVAAANRWVTTAWIDDALAGVSDPPNPHTPGATRAGRSLAGTVRLGLTT